ncbi:MAG: RNA-binding S4 domain-containing protein [Cytophagaceae bacterium]
MEIEFTLEGYEFIELNKLLKLLQLVSTGGEANIVIEDGEVIVNGETETRKRKKLRAGDRVEFEGNLIVIKNQ